jgi:competence protein ComGC
MKNELVSLLFASALLLIVIFAFVRVALRIRKHGGSLTTSMFAATYELYDKEKRAAIEQVVEQKVKKMEEEENDQPKEQNTHY